VLGIARKMLDGDKTAFENANAFMSRLLAARRPPLA